MTRPCPWASWQVLTCRWVAPPAKSGSPQPVRPPGQKMAGWGAYLAQSTVDGEPCRVAHSKWKRGVAASEVSRSVFLRGCGARSIYFSRGHHTGGEADQAHREADSELHGCLR